MKYYHSKVKKNSRAGSDINYCEAMKRRGIITIRQFSKLSANAYTTGKEGAFMQTTINCPCGNSDQSLFHDYDGFAGYEALICIPCGRFVDSDGWHEADNWLRLYMRQESKIRNQATPKGDAL